MRCIPFGTRKTCVSLRWHRRELLAAAFAFVAPIQAAEPTAGLSDAALQQVRADSAKHCDAFFRRRAGEPFVPAHIKVNWNNRGDYTRDYNHSVVLFAARALYL